MPIDFYLSTSNSPLLVPVPVLSIHSYSTGGEYLHSNTTRTTRTIHGRTPAYTEILYSVRVFESYDWKRTGAGVVAGGRGERGVPPREVGHPGWPRRPTSDVETPRPSRQVAAAAVSECGSHLTVAKPMPGSRQRQHLQLRVALHEACGQAGGRHRLRCGAPRGRCRYHRQQEQQPCQSHIPQPKTVWPAGSLATAGRRGSRPPWRSVAMRTAARRHAPTASCPSHGERAKQQ